MNYEPSDINFENLDFPNWKYKLRFGISSILILGMIIAVVMAYFASFNVNTSLNRMRCNDPKLENVSDFKDFQFKFQQDISQLNLNDQYIASKKSC